MAGPEPELVSVLFGVIVMARPGAGALGMLFVIAAWAILMGIVLVILVLPGPRLRQDSWRT